MYVNERGFAGEKPFVAKFCAECLAGMFADLFDEAVEHSVQSDEAVCTAKYHVALAEKGDTRCGVCGSPLRR